MKYPTDRFSSPEYISKLVDISTIVGITTIILFTMQAATRTEISSDIQQSLWAILVILILAAINIFGNIISKGSIRDNQIAESIVNVYGGDYQQNSQSTFELQTPTNYFDVLKTIEQIPVDIDRSHPGVQDILLELQSYILTEPNLSVEKRQIAMGKIQEIAIKAIEHPDNLALVKLVTAMQKIEGNQELRSILIRWLITITDESTLTSISKAIDLWEMGTH
jgi:hypothetical protein